MRKGIVTVAKSISVFALFLALSLFCLRKVIFSPGVITLECEWGIPPYSGQIKQLALADLYSWKPMQDFGSWSDYPSGLYVNLFFYLLTLFGMDGGQISKFISIFVMTSAGYSAYFLSRRMNVGLGPSIVAGMFYMLTPNMFGRLCAGHIYLLVDYVVAPLIIAFFINLMERGAQYKDLLSIILLFLIMSYAEYYMLTSLALLILCFAYGKPGKNHGSNVFLGLKSLFIVVTVVFFVKGMWMALANEVLFRTISLRFGGLPIVPLMEMGTSVEYTFRLLGEFPLSYFLRAAPKDQTWQIMSFLLPVLSLSAMLTRDKRANFLGLLVIVGITLSSAASGVLGSSWVWLLEYIPPLRVFRDPTKAIFLVCMGYAVLLGILCDSLNKKADNVWVRVVKGRNFFILNRWAQIRVKLVVMFFAVLMISCVICIYAWPFFTGDFGGYMQTYDFGQKYKNLWQTLSNDPDDYRVLMLPAPYPTVYADQKHFSIAYDVMSMYPGKPSLYVGSIYGPQFVRFVFKTLYENRTDQLGKLLGLANVKYLIFDSNKRTTSTDNVWVNKYFPEMRFTNDKLISMLGQQKDISLLNSDGSLRIYKNHDHLPHIYAVSQVGLVAGDLDTLIAITRMNAPQLKDMGLIFAEQLSSDELASLCLLPNVSIIIQKGRFLDLVLAEVPRKYWLNPAAYVAGVNPYAGWSLFTWGWYDWHYQTQLKPIVFTFTTSSLNIPFETVENGNYEVYAKIHFNQRTLGLRFDIDDSPLTEINASKIKRGFSWARLGSINLIQGQHTLSIQSFGGENAVESIVVVPTNIAELASNRATQLVNDKQVIYIPESDQIQAVSHSSQPKFHHNASTTQVVLGYSKVNPTKYLISAMAKHPFYIVFSESHHESWKIRVSDVDQIKSYPAYSFGNLFFINKTGSINLTLEFQNQATYDIGVSVSFASFTFILIAALLPTESLQSLLRISKQRGKNRSNKPVK